ncbi:hypothetical protein LZ480_14705 [Solibacillus sp. MA9]|uniref:YCII-related domain-containing protein n=1 Tax=Solibacillus palustris TaxID=2908203 RepID=A0ABS9UFM5_9BACL|nr:hypothetical protein [Solibacillus sp. MA9]MCH7323127.1 hypothetical protein [Solibacillus sp. MA9]
MSYFKVVVDGNSKQALTEREQLILQNSILHFSAMTNAIITGTGVMLNPPNEGTMGITFSYPEAIDAEKEAEVRESIVKRLNGFFAMSNLELNAVIN